MVEEVSYWRELADYDLSAARALLKSEHYLYVGFMCHQAVEKYLKAYFVKINGGIPPYTHNLELLCSKSGIHQDLSQDDLDFIMRIEPLNLESRYPSDRQLLSRALTKEKCISLISRTEELCNWIGQKL